MHRQLGAPAPNRTTLSLPEASGLTPEAGYVSFGNAAKLFWRKRWTLIAFAAAGLLLGVMLVLTQKRIYQAKTTIEVQMPNDDYLNRRQLNPVVEPGVILIEPFLQTQLRLLQTDTILLRVADRAGGREHPDLSPPPSAVARLRARIMPPPVAAKPSNHRAALLDNIHKRLTIRSIGTTQIIELLFESTDPDFASRFVNALAEEYRGESRSRVVDAASQTVELLSTQIDELKQSMELAENKLSSFAGTNSLMIPTESESFVEAQLRQTQSALGVAHETRVAEEAKYRTMSRANADELGKVLDSETLRSYRVRLTDLKQRLAEAVELYKPAHYTVRQIEAQIKEVETAFERERAGIVGRLRDQYESARLREDSLRRDYERQAGAVAGQRGKALEYTALKRDLDTRRQLYESMLQKVKEAGLISAMQASNVRVLDPAAPPELPVKPNKLLYTAIGLASGIVNGLLFVLVTGRHSLAPHTSTEVLNLPGIPHLAHIPVLTTSDKSPEVIPPQPDRELMLSGLGARSGLGAAGGSELVAYRRKDSEGARAFQTLVRRLFPSSTRARLPRIVTVTSACHGEGRTTVACNLGASLALAGLTVLLVDGDRINPRLHQVFGIPNETGFADLVARYLPGSDSAASEAAWMTEVPGLFALPGGRAMGRLAALVDDPRSAAVFGSCCRDFDVVIVDAPPVLALGEARGLSMHADAVLLVVHAGCATPELVAAAERLMAEDGAPLAGKVINCHEGLRSEEFEQA